MTKGQMTWDGHDPSGIALGLAIAMISFGVAIIIGLAKVKNWVGILLNVVSELAAVFGGVVLQLGGAYLSSLIGTIAISLTGNLLYYEYITILLDKPGLISSTGKIGMWIYGIVLLVWGLILFLTAFDY